jgi:hypothetical protein
VSALMLPIVKPPASPFWKAPAITVIVGTSKKMARKTKNGARGAYRPRANPRPVRAVVRVVLS